MPPAAALPASSPSTPKPPPPLPDALTTLLQEYTKAVLRECATTDVSGVPISGDPEVWGKRALCEFSAAYFTRQGERARGVAEVALRDRSIVAELVASLRIAETAAEAELSPEEAAQNGYPHLPLSCVLEEAESCGIPDATLNQVVQLTFRASGQDEHHEDITGSTPINAIHVCALCASLHPTSQQKGLRGVVESCLELFKHSSTLATAFECFIALDPVHRGEFSALRDVLLENPGVYGSMAMLSGVYPGLHTFGTAEGRRAAALRENEGEMNSRPASRGAGKMHPTLTSRPGTAVVSYTKDGELEETDANGTHNTPCVPDILNLAGYDEAEAALEEGDWE